MRSPVTNHGTLSDGCSTKFAMTKRWIALLHLALAACILTISTTPRVLTSTLGIDHVLEIPKLSAVMSNGPSSERAYAKSFSGRWGEFSTPTCFEYDIDYAGSNLRQLEDGSVRNPQACQQLCTQTSGCAYWTYMTETSACYLKSEAARQGRTRHSSAISGPRMCPPPHASCYELDTDYYGHDEQKFVDHVVRSPEECRLLCLAFPRCKFWTWVSSQRNCYLKNDYAVHGRIHVPGSISGPRQCIAVSPPPPTKCFGQECHKENGYEDGCYDHNVVYNGDNVEVQMTACGPRECQSFCQQHPACRGFTFFHLEKKCMLKSIHGQAITMANAISGPKFCFIPECALKDVEYYGKALESTRTSSFASCHKRCQFNHLCSAVSFEDSSQFCSLFQRTGPAQGFVSGPKWCTASGHQSPADAAVSTATNTAYVAELWDSFCYDPAVAYTSMPFSSTHVNSAELCQRHCRAQPRCKFFTYFLYGKTCLMHEIEGQRLPNETAVSGPRFCPPFACYHENLEVYGKEVGSCATEDAAGCQVSCQNNTLCSFFAYDISSKLCSHRQHRGSADGITSAPVDCGMPDDDITVHHVKYGRIQLVNLHSDQPHSPQKPAAGSPGERQGKNVGKRQKRNAFVSGEHLHESVTSRVAGVGLPDADLEEDESPNPPDVDFFEAIPDGSWRSAFLGVAKSDGGRGEGATTTQKQDVVISDIYLDEGASPPAPGRDSPDTKLKENDAPASPAVDTSETIPEGAGTPASLDIDKLEIDAGKLDKPLQLSAAEVVDEGNKKPLQSDCFTTGSYNDSLALEDTVAGSTEDCQTKCHEEKLCSFFSFFRDSGRCTLHVTAGNKMIKQEAVSGPWKCDAKSRSENCLVLGQYVGKGLNRDGHPSASVTECYLLCVAHQKCKFFTYDGSQFLCKMFDRVYVLRNAVTSVSGTRYCATTEASPCFQDGVRCEGREAAVLTVNSAHDCLDACQEDVSCSFYSYDKVTNMCSLLKNTRKDKRDDSAVCGAKHCFSPSFDPSCFHVDTMYNSESRTIPARSFPECYNLCDKDNTCRFFSFIGDEKTCHLHEQGVPVVDRKGAIGGAVHCGVSYQAEHCLNESSRYVGEIAETLEEVESPLDCQKRCTANPECRFFTYAADLRTCVLFKSRTRLLPAMQTTSGWRKCPDAEACAMENDLDIESYALLSFDMTDFDTCNAYCLQIDECSVASYDPSTEKCYLAPLFELTPGVLSGPLSCNAATAVMWTSLWGGQTPHEGVMSTDFCFQNNFRYAGPSIEQVSAASAHSCQLMCQRHPSCRFFSYGRADRKCHLYETSISSMAQTDYVSAPAWCTPPPINCIVENHAVYGQGTTGGETQTPEACVTLCRASPGSTYFTFDTSTGHCTCGFHPKSATTRDTAFKACIRSKRVVRLPELEAPLRPSGVRVSHKRMGNNTENRINPAGKKRLLFYQRLANYLM